MPSPDQKPHQPPNPHIDEMLRRMATPEGALAAEVAALREEIAALRAELAPVPSLILTGRQVLDEFKRLQAT